MADKIKWKLADHFDPEEFSEDPDRYARPKLIYTLNDYRDILGSPVHPSPVEGALARFDEADQESLHFCDENRRSEAVDTFPRGNPVSALMVALTSQLWGGIGFYTDTHYKEREWPMLHFDLRSIGHGHNKQTALLWIRRKGEYIYPQYDKSGPQALVEAMRWAKDMNL